MFGSRRPARASLIADDSASIAVSWPKTTSAGSFSRLASTVSSSLGDRLRRDAGDRGDRRLDLLDSVIILRRLDAGSSICAAPVSSITSIALSGSLRSVM